MLLNEFGKSLFKKLYARINLILENLLEVLSVLAFKWFWLVSEQKCYYSRNTEMIPDVEEINKTLIFHILLLFY